MEIPAQYESSKAPELKLTLSKAYFWYIVLCLIYVLDVMDRQCVAAILPALKSEFSLTDVQLGMLSSVFSLITALLMFPIAILADRWSRRKLITIMVAFWSLATFLTGTAKSFGTLLIARAAVGSGEAGYAPAAVALVSAWFPQRMRGLMIGIFHACSHFGAALGIVLAGYIAYRFGWRTVFGVLAIPGIALAVIAWFIPDYTAKRAPVENARQDEERPTLRETFGYIFTTPSLIYLVFAVTAFVAVVTSLALWGPTFIGRAFDMNIKDAARLMGIVSLITWVGSPLGGWAGDLASRRSPLGRIYVVASAKLLALIFGVIAVSSVNFKIFIIFWILGGFMLAACPSNYIAAIMDLSPAYFRSITYGAMAFTSIMLGAIWSPMVTGALSDAYGLKSALLAIIVVVNLIAVSFYLLAAGRYRQDLVKKESLGKCELHRA